MNATETTERTEADEIRDLARAENELFTVWLEAEPNEDGHEEPLGVEYWQAFDAWLGTYKPHILPIAYREMAALRRAYADWMQSEADDPLPRFWEAREQAHAACLKEPPELTPLKTPAELVAEKVSHRQIAKTWRIFREDGEPDIPRVESELAKPGTVLTPEHIAEVNRFRMSQYGFSPVAPPTEEPLEPAPATPPLPNLDTLIRDRATIAQIARIKSKEYGSSADQWVDLIPQLAELMGVELDVNAESMINEAGQETSEKRWGKEAVHRGEYVQPKLDPVEVTPGQDIEEQAEQEDIETRIIELFNQGNTMASIGRELNISPRKVKRAIVAWEDSVRDAPNTDDDED